MDTPKVTNPETGSTVPPAPPAPNRRYRRGLKSVKQPKSKEEREPLMDPATALHQVRAMVFQRAAETLTILRGLQEESSTLDVHAAEIAESLDLARKAFVETGLEVVRPIVNQLRELARLPDLKVVDNGDAAATPAQPNPS